MKAHRTLTREKLLRQGPARIALMVASEFGRASSRSAHPENVLACYARARELMGVLETIPMPRSVVHRLRPLYRRAAARELFQPARLDSRRTARSCAELAEEFNRAARKLSPS